MEIFLNPNVAYVMLVTGFLLTMLAIVTPGTGMLEVGAFFCLTLAAYGAYEIGFSPWALIVLILSLVPFAYAARKPQRRLWLGISLVAMLVSSLYLFNTEGWLPVVNPLLAVLVSALAGGFIWLTVSKTVKAHAARPAHDLGTLVGQIGEAKTEVHESGSVQVAGELWTARSETVIPAGTPVRVTGREGFVLVVEKAE
jgi:membrane-bound serine protease (ClpP class)